MANGMPAVSTWGEAVARYLQDATTCPVCGHSRLEGGCCSRCGADLRGPIGQEVWNASNVAAAAVRARDELLLRVPRSLTTAPLTAPTLAAAAAPRADVPARRAPSAANGSGATLQSVLAIAGAGLFAIAAIVFTFLNPDLSDRVLRSVIVGLVTLVFLGGSWLLARRGLQFSAEAVGGLGLVFVGLDVYAFAQLAGTAQGSWLLAALSTAVAGCVMVVAALRARIRVWAWGGLLGIALVPAMLGYSAQSPFVAALGHLGTAFLAGVLIERLPRLGERLSHHADRAPVAQAGADVRPPLQAERLALESLQVLAVLSAIPLAVSGALGFPGIAAPQFAIAAALALVALHAAFATRQLLPRWWSLVAGGSATVAVTVAVMGALAGAPFEWRAAVVPTAAAFAFALLSAMPLPASVSRRTLAGGAGAVLSAVSLIPLLFSATTALFTVTGFVSGATGTQVVADPLAWGYLIGLAGIASGLAVFGLLARSHTTLRGLMRVMEVASVLVAATAVLTLACAPLLPLAVRIAIVLTAAGAAALALRLLPAVRDAREGIRVALGTAIHLAILVGIVISWTDPPSAPLAGMGVIAVLALAGSIMPAKSRFLHLGAGFAYALVCIAQALSLTVLGSIAVLCLTTTAGLLVAITVTFLPQVGARSWYAVLVVTTVPFVAGIVQVVFERSGWTALSTTLMFALALALLLTRREGLNIVLRTAAAAMLVPTIAVVVVCLGAQVLAVSASPVTLPVIALLVAIVLPSTTLIHGGLQRRGLATNAASAARLAIEGSALLTGAIATVLALARDAAGLGTTFLVLVVLGVGAAASAVFSGRRYGWWVAGAAFTGALWCVWAMRGVDLLEAYLLPPALGAALVAVILTARGAPARGLFATGSAIAVLPSLALLILVEPSVDTATAVPWRALALLAAGGLLLAVGSGMAKVARLRDLATPIFAVAGLAAVAGPVQGIRMGLGVDLSFLHGAALFFTCAGVSAVAAVILILAACGIRAASGLESRIRDSRWLFAPAVLALAAGTWCSIERDWGVIWMMWALMLALLAVLLTAAVRAGRTQLPPVWFLFAVAFVTAVVAWSPRDLRVEWFSLPLGAFLLAAGIAGMTAKAGDSGGGGAANAAVWPIGRRAGRDHGRSSHPASSP